MRPIAPACAGAAHLFPAVPAHLLRLYLCLSLLGCASTHSGGIVTQTGDSVPAVIAARDLETRVVPAEARTLFAASVGALQDLGYTIQVADREAGLLTATRVSDRLLGAIGEPEPPVVEREPTAWSKAVHVAGMIGLYVLAIAALRVDAKERNTDTSGQRFRGADAAGGSRLRFEQGRTAAGSISTKTALPLLGGLAAIAAASEGPVAADITDTDVEIAAPTLYRYDVVVSITPHDRDATRVRISAQGAESRGAATLRSGPVRDPAFFDAFFAALDQALELDGLEAR